MARTLTALGLVLALLGPGLGCALTCKNFVTHREVMNSWIGSNLNAYESQNGLSPISAMVRPQHEHEYKYLTHDEVIQGQRYYCYDSFDVDDDTGKIVGWRSQGTYCIGYCAD